jgi:hypothetical protein
MNGGWFTVATPGNVLEIRIYPSGDWKITESHVEVVTAVADFPTNPGGNPRAGHFRWSVTTAPTTSAHVYSIPFADIPAVEGQTVYVAVHTVMVKTDMYGMIIQEETGWGGPCGTNGWNPGLPLPSPPFYKWGGNAWGYYFMFTL